MLLRPTPVALALTFALPGAALGAASAADIPDAAPAATASRGGASTPPAADRPHALGELTISATRTERATSAVPGTVTVITRPTLERRDARDLKDLLRDEVDLTVRAMTPRFTAAGASTGRAGNEGLNIRGLEGNRVLMMVDGIRLPQAFSFGAFASGRADLVDLSNLASAEVLRGPTSTSYGSDGLAGALVLRTLSPQDLLTDGKTFAARAAAGLDTADDARHASAALAFAHGDWQALVQAGLRHGHETRNRGTVDAPNSTRTKPNPADVDTHSALAKLSYRLNAAHRLTATAEWRERQLDMNVLSAVAPAATTPTAVLALAARDRAERSRVSVEHRYEDLNAPWLQQLTTQVYLQDSETRQFSAEDRNTAADRLRDGRYRERLIGLSSQAQTQLAQHRLSYGVDLSRNRIEGERDGTVPPAGESFPNKPFPDTDYTLAGAFVQDEVELGDLSLIPALRYEHYRLAPKAAGYNGATVALSDHAVSPRMGVIWRVTPALQPYAQWALGFRAPSPDQVNNGFANPTQGYRSIGNPDLRAERANSWELGLRGQLGEQLRWQLSAYHNRYRDFISQEVVSGTGTVADPLVFQYVNLRQARIRGLEARAAWDLTARWRLDASLASTRGHSLEAGVREPLDSVQPLRARLGARYDTGDWSMQASWQHSRGKRASDVSSPTQFTPPGYSVVDLGASLRLTPRLRLNAWVTNLFDKTYWRWSDVNGVAATLPTLDSFTATGRALQLSLRADF